MNALRWINQIWLSQGDAYLTKFPLLDSPFIYPLLLLLSVAIIYAFEHHQYKSHSRKGSINRDIRPLLLIHNGFCFGVYGVAILVLLIVPEFRKMPFSCNPPEGYYIPEIYIYAAKHLFYIYLLVTFVAFVRPLIQIWGRSPIEKLIDIYHHCIWSFICFLYVMFNPVGLSVALPTIDCLARAFEYGLSVLSTVKGKFETTKWNDLFRFIFFSFMAIHSTIFAFKANTCSPIANEGRTYQQSIIVISGVYATIVMGISIMRFLSKNEDEQVTDKQVLVRQKRSVTFSFR